MAELLRRRGGAFSARQALLDVKVQFGNVNTMPARSPAKPVIRKRRAIAKRKVASKGPSFGEWARRVAGMVKSGRKDLSSIEGFGD